MNKIELSLELQHLKNNNFDSMFGTVLHKYVFNTNNYVTEIPMLDPKKYINIVMYTEPIKEVVVPKAGGCITIDTIKHTISNPRY